MKHRNVLEFIDAAREDPEIYFGCRSITRFYMFLTGFDHALHQLGVPETFSRYRDEFYEMVRKRYRITTTHGWSSIIFFAAGHIEESGLDLFWEYWDEFKTKSKKATKETLSKENEQVVDENVFLSPQDADNYVRNVITLVRKRSAMYLGYHSITRFYFYLAGYAFALTGTTEEPNTLHQFNYMVHKKFQIEPPHRWGDLLLFEAGGSEVRGLDLFWQLWDQFNGLILPVE